MSNATNVSGFSLFQNATPTSAYLKAGIMGKQGAGKSRTAAEIAVGLVKHLKELGVSYANKPAAFFDTETGSDWLIPLFEKAGIPLVVAKKRSFADLLAAVRWAEENASILIIDSITHPWRELLESYMKKKQRSFLQIDDWGYLKGDHGWAQFTDLYINSKLHIVMCGRAGDDTEQYTDENGKRQFEKVGVKMKTEGETGFEPSLLILMEREMDLRTKDMAHVAKVLKDRSDLLDGKEFTNPTFADFLPHINRLNLGGAHVGVNLNGDSQHILKVEKKDWTPVQREICIDEIQTLLALHYPSQSAEDKKNKLKAVLAAFRRGLDRDRKGDAASRPARRLRQPACRARGQALEVRQRHRALGLPGREDRDQRRAAGTLSPAGGHQRCRGRLVCGDWRLRHPAGGGPARRRRPLLPNLSPRTRTLCHDCPHLDHDRAGCFHCRRHRNFPARLVRRKGQRDPARAG
jgi:hypothetical protein